MPEPMQARRQPSAAERIRAWKRKNPAHLRKPRTVSFPIRTGADLLADAVNAVWPWSRAEYPGRMRLRAWLLGGIDPQTARRYRNGDIPRCRLPIVSARLRLIAARLIAAADAIDNGQAVPPMPNSNSDSG